MDFTEEISFIFSPQFSGWLLILKIIFIIFSLFLLVFIVFALLRTGWLKKLLLYDLVELLTYRPFGTRRIVKQWAKITARLETGIESEAKLAIIEADSMLDDILKKMGYGGESLGDRLKSITTATIQNIAEIWEAHKIRNNIVHDPDYRLTLDQARKVLGSYEQAFRDLHAFD